MMTSTNPWIHRPSRLLRALLASPSSSVGYENQLPTTMLPISSLSRVILHRELQQLSNEIQSSLFRVEPAPVAVGIDGPPMLQLPRSSLRTSSPSSLVLQTSSRSAGTDVRQPAPQEEADLLLQEVRLPPKKRMKLSRTLRRDDWSETSETTDADEQEDPPLAHKKSSPSSKETPVVVEPEFHQYLSKLTTRSVSADQHWEDMFKRLLVYKTLHGDCKVPKHYDGDPKLGKWVYYQRKLRNKMKPDRKKRLDEIGFAFCLKKRDAWEFMFQQLVDYKNKHGHCLTPQNYKENRKLGKWVAIQRFNKENLSQERKGKLIKIGFVWSANKAMWNNMFRTLVEYKVKNGHCRVPYNYKADPALANWVRRQRQNLKYLSGECLELLRTVGFFDTTMK